MRLPGDSRNVGARRLGGRGRTALLLVFTLFATAWWAAAPDAEGDACGTAVPTDPAFYEGTVRGRPDHWLGADALGSIDLGNGRLLWLFGDTNWGSRRAGGAYADGWTFVTNSIGDQQGRCAVIHSPFRNFAEPSAGADLYWPNDGWADGDDVYVVFSRIQLTSGGTVFSFRSIGQELVRLDRATLAVESRQALPDTSRDWGSSVERVGDTLFWWGRSFSSDTGSFYLARSSVLTPLLFEYRAAGGWTSDPGGAVAVHRRGQTSNATFHRLPDGRWAAVFKDHEIIGTGVIADVAANPWGPFAHMGRIATAAPRTRGAGEITYSASLHPAVGWSGGRMLVRWSHNSLDHRRVTDGSVRYQPSFTSVPTSVLSRPEGYAELSRKRNFVVAAFRTFTGAKPSGPIADHWANQLNFGTPRAALAGALSIGDGWIGAKVDDVHRAGLGRPTDPLTRSRWIGAIRGGARLGDVVAEVFSSTEAFARSGADNRRFVDALYRGVLGRGATAGEADAWGRRLDAGTARSTVVRTVHASVESRQKRVRDLYGHVLGRTPDRAGIDRWTGFLAGGDDLGVAARLAASAEYLDRAQRLARADR